MKQNICYLWLFAMVFLTVFTGCQKDDALTPQQQNEEQHAESRFARTQIDFKTFKSKISDTKIIADIERKMHKNTPKSGGTNDFILYIDTSRIIEYSNDSITTYTMTVITSDQDTEKFTNIVLKEDKGVVTTYLLRYTPTEQWKEDTLNGNKGPFSGVISILDNDGTVLFEAEVEDYMEINSTSFSACSATIEPMIYCTNPNNPNPYVCVCGVSFVVGYVVVYGEDCSGNGGGPNDGPLEGDIPGSGGGESDGGSTGPGNTGEFPTEPNFDYMLIHNLNALLQPPLTFQQEEWIMANEENYQFALEIYDAATDGTLINPFPFVRYPPGSNYTSQHPKLTEYLRNQLPTLKDHNFIISKIEQHGDLSAEEIKEQLQWGKGPIVDIVQLDNYCLSCSSDTYGLFQGNNPDTLLIDLDLVNDLEQSTPGSMLADAFSFLIGVTILHEFVHYIEYQDGSWNSPESGILFEVDVYGQTVWRNNAHIILKK